MEAAIGLATGLVDSVLTLLSNELVGAYVASAELGLNCREIKRDLMFTQGLLHEAQRSGVVDNHGLQGLMQELSTKADEAEDALDELHYFIIQDDLDGTKYAVPDLGDDLRGHARHGRLALRHTIGNCLACFSCSHMHGGDVTNNPHIATNPYCDGRDKLPFDRVEMSKKIQSVVEEIHSLCDPVSKLLKIIPHHSSNSPFVTLKRPLIGSTTVQDRLFGRRNVFEQTIKDIITNSSETLSVIPIVGPGGIGKTTFTQHLYNDERTQQHFPFRAWVCVSTDFDVFKVSQEILSCIEGKKTVNQSTSLDQIQISITRELKPKRFLIVLDDIWECNSQGWENLLAPLMKGEAKGSMVLVTTRFPSKADIVKTTDPIALKGLEPDEFFTFFESFIFAGQKPEGYHDGLTHIARDIAKKLKGSPLAAKTVGRMLKKDLSREYWMRVLENNEWQNEKNADDILPSLRISYDYLPFHLKKCFPYFALFPEDHRFKNLEIIYFLIAIGIIDKDENYMDELVDNGFLVKENDDWEDQYYVLHDLLHELARNISSKECLNIYSSASFRAVSTPKSIRHLSITMKNKYDGNFTGEIVKFKSDVDFVNLRTLMIFRGHAGTIDVILKDIFKDIKGLRVLYIDVESPEYFPHNLSKFIHLRYLKITRYNSSSQMTLPSILSGFYHLKYLDLSRWYGSDKLPKDISRLTNLCHLLEAKELDSDIPNIGKMKCLKGHRKFCVKKESVGFELSQLGELTELGGELKIYNLEKVATKEEAMKAKLVSKADLKKLELLWGTEHDQGECEVLGDSTELSDVIDGLEPHPNLQSLVIKNHGGSICPSWLCGSIGLLMLTSLCLEDVSWTILPLGRLLHLTSLTLRNIPRLGQIISGSSDITDRSFSRLKKIVLVWLPELTEWVGTLNAHLFSRLEFVLCNGCPNLGALPFLREGSASYTSLSTLRIINCPKLFLPSMPVIHGCMEHPEHDLSLTRHSGAFQVASKFTWAQLPKLTSLKELMIVEDPGFLSISLLSNLTSLTSLKLEDCENLEVDGFNPLITAVNLKKLAVNNMGRDRRRSLAADLLSELVVANKTKQLLPDAGCFQLDELEVDSSSVVLIAPVCSLFAATLHELFIRFDQRVESFTEEEENALQLLTSLQQLKFGNCPGLPSLPRGLHRLSSLELLSIDSCPEIQLLPKEGLPASLQDLFVMRCSPELTDQAKNLKATYPGLRVTLNF
uniref:Powdery mildew resistance-related protein n=1 Tax=Triticum urartu TaxID=4572 RepID=A0A2I6STE4_TRIUA|nr:powdery mildew resistance-related protein [Triticum urartu]